MLTLLALRLRQFVFPVAAETAFLSAYPIAPVIIAETKASGSVPAQ